jgi:hypothetical protein
MLSAGTARFQELVDIEEEIEHAYGGQDPFNCIGGDVGQVDLCRHMLSSLAQAVFHCFILRPKHVHAATTLVRSSNLVSSLTHSTISSQLEPGY